MSRLGREGKVAVVKATAGSIEKAIAETFADVGANVAILDICVEAAATGAEHGGPGDRLRRH